MTTQHNIQQSGVLGQQIKIFEQYRYPDLIKQIHQNNEQRKQQIQKLINQMSGLITDMESAMTLSTIIMDLFKLTIANDNQLIQIAKVIQKYVASLNANKKLNGQGQVGGFQQIFNQIQAIANNNAISTQLQGAVDQIVENDLIGKKTKKAK